MTTLAARPSGGNGRVGALETAERRDPPFDPSRTDRFTPDERLADLLPELRRHPELDLKTLCYHLEQSDATAADGYWHAAINEARSFVEALVIGMALVERRETMDTFRKGKENSSGFRFCRRYLHEIGLLDGDEEILLQNVYGMASAKGSHQGVTDEAWCRLARRMIWTTGYYLLGRYDAWKRSGHRPTVLTGRAGKSLGKGTWRDGLSKLVHRVADGLSS